MIRSKLKAITDARGLSIRQLAEEADCHYEVVRRMYNDTMERYPRDLLDKLCAYLKVTPGELLEHIDETK